MSFHQRLIGVLAGGFGLWILAPPSDAHAICLDEGSSDPDNFYRVEIQIEKAKITSSIDGDFLLLWTNEADTYPSYRVNGGPWTSGPTRNGTDRPAYEWTTISDDIDRDDDEPEIEIKIIDRDSPDLPDLVDINSAAILDTIILTLDACRKRFTADTAALPAACDASGCQAGVLQWLGKGNDGDWGNVFATVRTAGGVTIPPMGFPIGDVSLSGLNFVQVIDDPAYAARNRNAMLRARVRNDYEVAKKHPHRWTHRRP